MAYSTHMRRICVAYKPHMEQQRVRDQLLYGSIRHYCLVVGCRMGWQGGTCPNSATPHTMYPYSHTIHNTIYIAHKKEARV